MVNRIGYTNFLVSSINPGYIGPDSGLNELEKEALEKSGFKMECGVLVPCNEKTRVHYFGNFSHGEFFITIPEHDEEISVGRVKVGQEKVVLKGTGSFDKYQSDRDITGKLHALGPFGDILYGKEIFISNR